MPATLPHRIVRRAVMALAVMVLLLSGYVSSYFTAQWLNGRQMIPVGLQTPRRGVYAPLILYAESDSPGGETFCSVAIWFRFNGEASFDECRDYAVLVRQRGK